VDAVLNLGEEASLWVKGTQIHQNDRAINRGEGSSGMAVPEICEEAQWVIERLEQNQRVLVHCVAGMNRSVTIGCAVLMLLEGLSAQAALERVRQHHPWARPDSHHWLALRWLEKNKKE
jgi:protein-tyrosine phosphatase